MGDIEFVRRLGLEFVRNLELDFVRHRAGFCPTQGWILSDSWLYHELKAKTFRLELSLS